MMKIGMEFWIDYAHHLPGHELCGRPHGHTAQIIVEVLASQEFVKMVQENDIKNYGEAMAIDFKDLKKSVKNVIDKLDHQNLNDFFKYPSSEVTCNHLWDKLNEIFYLEQDQAKSYVTLYSVRFYEGHGKYVEITAD